MKKFLPLLVSVVLMLPAYAQMGAAGNRAPAVKTLGYGDNPTVKIFPNPATDYIELSENNTVSKIIVYNLVGREMKRFEANDGERYFVGDLARGLYLVQLLDDKNQTLTTQRVSKR